MKKKKSYRAGDRNQDIINYMEEGNNTMRKFFECLSLTHAVNAQLNLQSDKYEIKVLTPDERAFVDTMNELDYKFDGRVQDILTMKVRGESQIFKIVLTMPFDPSRKKMSVILKTADDRYILYLKGADSSIMPHVKMGREEKRILQEKIDNYGLLGYRIMVFAQRVISKKLYQQFKDDQKMMTNSTD